MYMFVDAFSILDGGYPRGRAHSRVRSKGNNLRFDSNGRSTPREGAKINRLRKTLFSEERHSLQESSRWRQGGLIVAKMQYEAESRKELAVVRERNNIYCTICPN